jgi:hypothetical protein
MPYTLKSPSFLGKIQNFVPVLFTVKYQHHASKCRTAPELNCSACDSKVAWQLAPVPTEPSYVFAQVTVSTGREILASVWTARTTGF